MRTLQFVLLLRPSLCLSEAFFDSAKYHSCIRSLDFLSPLTRIEKRPCKDDLSLPLRVLGSGESSTVHAVLNCSTQSVMAVKISKSPIYTSAFHREACLMSSIRHLNIPTFYCAFQTLDSISLVMELIEGIPTREMMHQMTPRELEELGALLLWEIGGLLTFLHSHGIVHLDVQVENVVFRGRRPYLIDYGRAEHSHEETSRYYDYRSLGLMLRELFAGKGSTYEDLVDMLVHGQWDQERVTRWFDETRVIHSTG